MEGMTTVDSGYREEFETKGRNGDATPSWRKDGDVSLMEEVRDGDVDAFESLFRRHYRPVVSFAYRMLGSVEAAEEVAQTVFLQLYRARDHYEAKARFTTYLYRIARNTCLNELRRASRRIDTDRLDAEDGAENDGRLADEPSAGPAEQVSGREIAAEVKRAMERLSPHQREALELGRIGGVSYGEVAEVMDMSVSAVKSLIFRATRALRDDLEEYLH